MSSAAIAPSPAPHQAAYRTLQVSPVTTAIGGEIQGVDLSRPLGEEQFAEIRAALLERQVIFFHGQTLGPEQLIAFAQRFGDLQPASESSFANNAAFPEIDILDFDGDRPPYNTKEMWHTDFSGRERPTQGSVLYAQEVPATGGDTIWVSQCAAYEALSAPMKQYLARLKAEHRTVKAFGDDIRSRLWKDEAGRKRWAQLQALPFVEHPVVRTHPVTGRKALYINEGYTYRLLGVDRKESDAVLAYLFQHLVTPEFQVRFRWRRQSVAVWDNQVTLHYAVADYAERRVMSRVTIQGDRPF
jgi:taurine dioxygenase